MAAFAKPAAKPSLASILLPPHKKISGLIAGEDLDWLDPCYIKASDGKVYRSTGAAVNAAAKVRGYAAMPAKAAQGDAVTLIRDFVAGWASAVAPGTDLYVDTTAGGLSTTATTGGTGPVGFVIDANRVYLDRSYY